MRSHIHPFPENSLVGSCIRLAQTTFFDAMPARADVLLPKAPVALPPAKAEPFGQRLARWTESLEQWLYRQRMKDRDAWLAQSQDVFELERRVRELDRRPYF
jgi:Protein of unknown function (DUF3563)